VRRDGWTDLPSVREAAQAWLADPSPALRALGCRLAGDFRLADLVDELESALLFATTPELAARAEEALVLLGARLPPSEAGDAGPGPETGREARSPVASVAGDGAGPADLATRPDGGGGPVGADATVHEDGAGEEGTGPFGPPAAP
jgi:hypothetical protein